MIEQIRKTTGNHNGHIVYWIEDKERGVPYTAVTVNPSGDYWLTTDGRYCFGLSSHKVLLEHANPCGVNITAEMFYKRK